MSIYNTIIGGNNPAKDCNATAADILSGKTAAVGKNIVTGTMPNIGASLQNVSTLNDSTGELSSNIVNIIDGSSGGDTALRVEFVPPKGYYDGINSKINMRLWGITQSVIKSGTPIGNVKNPLLTGTYAGVEPKGKVVTNTVAAGQTINAGDFIRFGKGTVGTPTRLSTTNNSAQDVTAVEIENNRILVLSYRSNAIWASVYTVSQNSLIFNFENSIASATVYGYSTVSRTFNMVHLGNNRIFILFSGESGNSFYGLTITVGSNSITVNQYTQLYQSSQSTDPVMCLYDVNKICITYRIYASCFHIGMKLINISPSNNTFSTIATQQIITGVKSDSYSTIALYPITNNKVLTINQRSGSIYGNICTFNDNSITVGTQASGALDEILGIKKHNSECIIGHRFGYVRTASYGYLIGGYFNDLLISISGDTFTCYSKSKGSSSVSESEVDRFTHIYGDGMCFSRGQSTGSYLYISYDNGYNFSRINLTGGQYAGYENEVVHMKDGTIVCLYSYSTSPISLNAVIVSRPPVYKAEPFFAEGIALTGGTEGTNINICVE